MKPKKPKPVKKKLRTEVRKLRQRNEKQKKLERAEKLIKKKIKRANELINGTGPRVERMPSNIRQISEFDLARARELYAKYSNAEARQELEELASRYGLHSTQLIKWFKQQR